MKIISMHKVEYIYSMFYIASKNEQNRFDGETL